MKMSGKRGLHWAPLNLIQEFLLFIVIRCELQFSLNLDLISLLVLSFHSNCKALRFNLTLIIVFFFSLTIYRDYSSMIG